jgi:hypothetical protein
MEDHEDFPRSEDPSSDDSVELLARQLSTLTDFLSCIEDDAQLIDASLKDVHEIAASICKAVKRNGFGSDGPLAPSSYRGNYDALNRARLEENDVYEVYADNLERHQKRQRRDLGVAESDSDKFAVVKRRRGYICALMALQAQVSGVLDILSAQHGSPGDSANR